jgi:HipA-like protein
MRCAKILYKSREAAVLTQTDDGRFELRYLDQWAMDNSKPDLSPALPKTLTPYESDYLFAFFYHMLPEGANKQAICAQLRIDSADDFSLLLATAQSDAIGAVRVVQMEAQ